MAGIEDILIPGVVSLAMFGVILWFAFKHKFKPKEMNQTPSTPAGTMGMSVGVGTSPALPTVAPRTSSTLSPPPVQNVVSPPDQVWEQKATRPDPFSSEPRSEAEAKAKQVMVLLPYIRQYRSQGFSDEQIVDLLTRNGWPDQLVHIGLEQA
jgi:hypothetical protein